MVNELAPTTSVGPYVLNLYTDNPVITLRAVQSGVSTSFSYGWLAACNPGARLGSGSDVPLKVVVPAIHQAAIRWAGAACARLVAHHSPKTTGPDRVRFYGKKMAMYPGICVDLGHTNNNLPDAWLNASL